VGLANTGRRLALLSDGHHEIRLEDLTGGRVRVELVIPFRTAKGTGESRVDRSAAETGTAK
jgi:hypothetical protein